MPIFQYLRRRWILRKPFPESWQNILDRNVPYYRRLPRHYRETLKKRMMVFMNEKLFEGCGGLELTEKIRVVVSAYACILLLEEPSDYYPDLQAILIYPGDYVAPVQTEDRAGIITKGSEARKGESWSVGSIVLSWNDIQENIYQRNNRKNLIFHEFAHQLDQRYGLTAGISEEGDVYQENEWNNVISKAFKDLRTKARRSQHSVLDMYGATNPAEFFSVATEAYFENPRKLRSEHSALYNMLKSFYGVDPFNFPTE